MFEIEFTISFGSIFLFQIFYNLCSGSIKNRGSEEMENYPQVPRQTYHIPFT